mgnify:CR=1 FL=1
MCSPFRSRRWPRPYPAGRTHPRYGRCYTIGTYQAKSVTISGIPAGVDDNDVRLISYVGDDIAFRSGPTVGKMSEDYRYGDGANDV